MATETPVRATADISPNSKGVALVTGSAQGIGRSIALRLASEGYDIGLNDVEVNHHKLVAVKDEVTRQYPERQVCILPADVSLEEQVKNMIQELVKTLGRLDVMVANAGILRSGSILQANPEDWDTIFAVNVRGTFLCYKYAAQQMIAQGTKGRIIGASSVAGKKGFPFLGAYGSSKFALRGLTQTAAVEFGKYGITVNAYAPGLIDTAMMDTLQEDTIKFTGDKGGIIEQFKIMAALGHLGTPADVAGIVSYLVSPEARFITGQTISIDGGTNFD